MSVLTEDSLNQRVDRCLCFHLRRVSRRLTQTYDRALKPADLTSGQFVMLACVALEGPITVTALGRLLDLETSATGRALRILQDQGLIEPVEAEDHRQHRVRLTDEGRRRIELASGYWERAQREVETAIGDAPVRDLVAAADRAWQRLNENA